MGWKWLKSLGPALLTALTTFLEVIGGLCIYFVGLAEDADTAAMFVWTLKGVAGISIFAGAITAAAAVAVSLPSKFRPNRVLLSAAALLSITASLLAGWYVGSLISSITERDQPRESRVYARQLTVVLVRIERERHSAYQRLEKAGSSQAQGEAARALAQSFSQGADAIRAIHAPSKEKSATMAIARRSEDVSRAYRRFAAAALDARGDQELLDRARQRVNRLSRRLRAAEFALKDHGYEIAGVQATGGNRLHSGSQNG